MCGVWRGYDVAGVGGGEFTLRLVSHQRVAPPYWRSDTHTHTVGTNTFYIINYKDIPSHKRNEISHTMVICEVCPEKDDPDRTRITIGGNRICYLGNVGTNTALLELVKLLLNSVLSRKGALFSTIDLKNFYLDTPMPDPKYVCIKLSDIPVKFIKEYNLLG
jgi:hypothetical protein